MPLRNNRNIRKTKPHIIRSVKNNVIKNNNTKGQSNINNIKKSINNPPNSVKPKDTNYGKTTKIWVNEVVYIIGGGPSLKNFDWTKLEGKKVIAINRAFEVLPKADILYWTDSRFYKWNTDNINKFKGLKFTCRSFRNMPNDITLLKSVNNMNINTRPSYITHGNNSGFGAINLAVKLGAKKIYLLGYDMSSNPENTHWHSGYQLNHNHNIYNKMIKYFESLPNELKKLKIECYNANMKSKLNVFRKCTLSDAINDLAYNPFQNT